MSSKFKPWLVLAIIFIAGILTGAALTIALSPQLRHAPLPHDMKKAWMARLTDRLKLTPDQQAKIESIVTDATTKIQALHHEEIQRGAQLFKATDEQIAALLTADQQEELKKMEAEREKMFSGHMHRHPGPDDQGGMPPPPPSAPPANAPPANP